MVLGQERQPSSIGIKGEHKKKCRRGRFEKQANWAVERS